MKTLSVEPPHAIVTVGIIGSGKSYFAQKFAETFKAPYIQQEHIEQYASDPAATQELINTMIEQIVKTRQSIVIDINTASRADRLSLSKYLRQVGYEPLFVWVQTDRDTAAQRTIRARKIQDADYDTLNRRFSQPHQAEHALVLSGKHTYSSQAKIVLKKLSASRTGRAAPDRVVPPRGKILIR